MRLNRSCFSSLRLSFFCATYVSLFFLFSVCICISFLISRLFLCRSNFTEGGTIGEGAQDRDRIKALGSLLNR